MHVLFLTTLDASYSVLLTTWLALLLHSLSSQVVLDSKGSSVEYSLAVGCMPSAHRINDGRKADRLVSLPVSGIQCTHMKDIPGFENDGKKHLKQFFVSYPDVRRMMMVKAFASTGKYDMIVYSDIDAFIVRNPMPDLMPFWTSKYSAVFSRANYNASTICNGFYALNDMSLPKYWIGRGVYSQNEINNWISAEKTETLDFHTSYTIRNNKTGDMHSLGLLPEPDYFRGGCGTLMVPTRRVEHCQSVFFNGKKKIETFGNLSRLLAADDEKEQSRVAKVLTQAVESSSSSKVSGVEGAGLTVSDFTYLRRDGVTSKPQDYSLTLYSYRLKPSPALYAAIRELPRWGGIKAAYQL